MALLYGRQISVTVAGLAISEPRINISIDLPADDAQPKAVATVYNLRENNAERIYERGGPITIAAGYADRIDTVFEGIVQRVFRERADLAFTTRIEAGSMVRAPSVLGGTISLTLDGPVPVREIVRQIVAQGMPGLTLGPLDAIPEGATFTDFSWSLTADSALTNQLGMLDLYWFEDNGAIRIAKAGEPQSDAPRLAIHGPSEIVRRPVVTDEGAELTLFLRPEVVRGSVLDVVDSRYLSGSWRVVAMRHNGDNWDGAFTTWAELRAAA